VVSGLYECALGILTARLAALLRFV